MCGLTNHNLCLTLTKCLKLPQRNSKKKGELYIKQASSALCVDMSLNMCVCRASAPPVGRSENRGSAMLTDGPRLPEQAEQINTVAQATLSGSAPTRIHSIITLTHHFSLQTVILSRKTCARTKYIANTAQRWVSVAIFIFTVCVCHCMRWCLFLFAVCLCLMSAAVTFKTATLLN